MRVKHCVVAVFYTTVVAAIICKELRQCEEVTEAMCTEELPYNTTAYPNMLGYSSQTNSGMDRGVLYRLLQQGCSKHLRLFTCLVYVPPCSGIRACRSFCRKVRDECTPALQNFGVDWLDDLRCDDRFPDNHCVVEGGLIMEGESSKKYIFA